MSGEGVYILELDQPLGNAKHQASFYVGYTRNLEGRLYYHERGQGAAFTRAAVERGIGFKVALFIPGAGREVERKIKASKNIRRWIASYQRKQVS
jgi:putative endonuclease